MATTKADAEYLERMLRLHPWGDAEVIVAERVAHLKARDGRDEVSNLTETQTAAPLRSTPIGGGLLSPGWHLRACQLHVPVVRARTSWFRFSHSGTPPATFWLSLWLWSIGISLLACVVRSLLTANR
jgi:hypothetical protein